MVAPADNVTRAVEANLHALESELAFLPEAACSWSDWGDQERDQFRYMWDIELAARLAALQKYRGDGLMTVSQIERFQAVLARIEYEAPAFAATAIRPPAVVQAA